ncbi:MAG: FeoB-associated Cys-rich membrane protein [Clostridiales bacterium]|nr:FeoB-associated Cys-rich membrane protein [Clostridiales bacterium]
MEGIIIGLLIVAYTIFVIRRQVKNIKAGNYCGSCSSCGSAKTCGQLNKMKESK